MYAKKKNITGCERITVGFIFCHKKDILIEKSLLLLLYLVGKGSFCGFTLGREKNLMFDVACRHNYTLHILTLACLFLIVRSCPYGIFKKINF